MTNKSISIFLHIYYEDTFIKIYNKIYHLLKNSNILFFINIDYENPSVDRIINLIKWKIPNAVVIKSPNKGKDIGAKFLLLSIYLELKINCGLMLFLHDKKSPQLIDGPQWSESLYSIIQSSKLEKVMRLFDNNGIGMIGSKGNKISIKNESEEEIFMGNKDTMMEIARKYDLFSNDFSFISGTMFWVRSEIITNFFVENSPLEIRNSLESGNVMDNFGATNTHSWERLLGWIVSTSNYQIIEI